MMSFTKAYIEIIIIIMIMLSALFEKLHADYVLPKK